MSIIKRVKLSEIIENMGFQPDESITYLDRETGEFILLTSDIMRAAEENDYGWHTTDWEIEMIEAAKVVAADEEHERFIPLSSKLDISEYSIMERFCGSIANQKESDILYRSLRGRGTFRRFKDSVRDLGIEKEWYSFRDEALGEIAILYSRPGRGSVENSRKVRIVASITHF